jgi:glycosyltransferase involved in cell wall biosynthesis
MHIALVSPSWPVGQAHNGIVTYVHWLRQGLLRQGHRVTVITGALSDPRELHGVHVVRESKWSEACRRLRRRFSAEPPFAHLGRTLGASIRRVHHRDPIDLIEMEESFGWSRHVQRAIEVPVVVKLHGPAFLTLVEEDLFTLAARQRIEEEGRGLAVADAITSPTRITLDETLKHYSLHPSISEHIVNPLSNHPELSLWSETTFAPASVLFVGRFDKPKGGDLMILAFRSLLRTHPHAKLVFVGPDNGLKAPDGRLIHFAEYLSSQLVQPYREKVTYLGRLAPVEVAQLRVRANVVVVASRWESQGYTALEAMIQGCPLVATDAGGLQEAIEDGTSGLLATGNDPESLAGQIRRVLDSPGLASSLGAQGRQRALRIHSPDNVARRTIAVYERVLALPPVIRSA